jgi:drug/metabolite transporter (DMT)-like permease
MPQLFSHVYLEMMFASTIGTIIFDDQISRTLITGSLIIVGSGLFALNRDQRANLSALLRR